MTNERRRFSRVDFEAEVELEQGDYRCTAELIDISLKGLLLHLPQEHRFDEQQPVDACVHLSDQTPISMSTRIAHQSQQQLGLMCELIDLDSIGHLRRLIELNLGDPKAAERELAELIHNAKS
jgi:hypothetical protein